MAFSTNECAWAQISMKILGATVTGLRGFSFKKGVEKEHLYAAGADPVDIQSGNKKPEGNIKVLKYELDKFNDAAQLAGYADITEVPHELISITCAFKKTLASPMFIIEAIGVAISEYEVAAEQNAKNIDVTLPWLAMKVTSRKA